MEKLLISLAYKYVALSLMMAEANHAVQKLDVAGWKPVEPTNIVSYFISPPRLRPGGSLDTATHMFGFGLEGKLQFIHRRDSEPELSLEERHQRWAKMKSLIETNGAYALASNWLVRLDVDVPALQRDHPASVVQEYYHPGGQTSKSVMLPRYEIRWGTNMMQPAVWVSIFGPTKEPIHIRQDNISYSKRPAGLVKDAEKLLAIGNGEFANWTFQQKSNLVAESAVVNYSHLPLPEVVPAEPGTSSKPAGKQRTNTSLRVAPRALPGACSATLHELTPKQGR